MDILKRFKSPVVISSILGILLFILKNYGFLIPLGLTEDSYKEITGLIISLLTILGILNNPTDSSRF